jgi:hypothetical protein
MGLVPLHAGKMPVIMGFSSSRIRLVLGAVAGVGRKGSTGHLRR